MENPSAHIQVATAAHRAGVVATVRAAFDQDPAFRFFFPTDDEFNAEVPVFVGALFDHRVGHDATWVLLDPDLDAEDPAAVMAVAMWSPPSAAAHGTDLSALTPASVARLDRYDEATNDGLPDGGFWYLGILATHPDHWGHRYGRLMMEPGLIAASASGIDSYLETTKDSNVALYQRAGWTVTAVNAVDDLEVTVLRGPSR